MDSFLFFGFGYSAKYCAQKLQEQNGRSVIFATKREKSEFLQLSEQNITPLLFDGKKPNKELNEVIGKASHIIHSIAPDENGDAVLNHYGEQIARAKNLKWICYFSTIGVYGNHDGLWIDESAKCQPKNLRSKWRLRAEKQWLDFAKTNSIPLLILRLAGIYGKNRSVFDKLQKGTSRRIIKKGQVFNRIHVKDIANVTILAAQKKLSGIYNLCDDKPAPPQDVILYASKLLNITPPPKEDFAKAKMTQMARSFYNDNKRVSNKAIKQALDMELLFPTYHEGLLDILAGQ